MALNANALVSVAEYKVFDGNISGSTDDSLIESMINAASVLIENATGGTVYVQRTFTEDYTASNHPKTRGGAKRLYLQKRPIVSVTSITDDDSNTVSSDDYTIVKDQGYLEHDWAFTSPTYRWTVVYIAGTAASITAVAWNVKQACCLEVHHRLYNRAPDVTSKSRSGRGGSRSVSMDQSNKAGLTNDAYALIQPDVVRWF